jgi:hypothetical protein
MDSLKLHPGPLCSTLLRPAGGPPLKRPYSHFKACSLAVFYPFGYPTPYAYVTIVYEYRPDLGLTLRLRLQDVTLHDFRLLQPPLALLLHLLELLHILLVVSVVAALGDGQVLDDFRWIP